MKIKNPKLNKIHGEIFLQSDSLKLKLALTEERVKHLHPEVLAHAFEFYDTINNGDKLKKSTGEIILYKWFKSIYNGKFMVVVVINKDKNRPFIVTAMVCRKKPKGEKYEN